MAKQPPLYPHIPKSKKPKRVKGWPIDPMKSLVEGTLDHTREISGRTVYYVAPDKPSRFQPTIPCSKIEDL